MNYEKLIEKVDRIYKLQDVYKNDFDSMLNEVYIHLNNGQTALSDIHGFVFDSSEQRILCSIDKKYEWVNIADIRDIAIGC